MLNSPSVTRTPPARSLRDNTNLHALCPTPMGYLERLAPDDVKILMKEIVAVGALIPVCRGYGGTVEIYLDVVVGVNARAGRFYTARYAANKRPSPLTDRAAWYFTGQSADAPKGQSRAFPPLPELVDAALSRRQLMFGKLRDSAYPSIFGAAALDEHIQAAVAQTEKLFGCTLERAKYS